MAEDRRDSVALRKQQEQRKAERKYGQDGLEPGGHPDYDILDYAINEVVGLSRYAEMIRWRIRNMGPLSPAVRGHAEFCVKRMEHVSSAIGHDLIQLRNLLLDMGWNLGEPEPRD